MEPWRSSPRWSTRTKFLVALVFVALVSGLLMRFHSLISPLIMAVILAYLLNPVVVLLTRHFHLPHNVAVGLVFLALVLLLLSLLGGLGMLALQQLAGLIGGLQTLIASPPAWVNTASAQPVVIGPWVIHLSASQLASIQDALLSEARALVGTLGQWATAAASSLVQFFAWMVFILAVSLYLLHDLFAVQESLVRIVPPIYREDAERLLADLGPIWNSFLRGQSILALVMAVVVGATMTALGLRYSLVIGVTAGVVEFVPIIGPLANGIAAVLIALFQPGNWLGLTPIAYAAVVAIAAFALQQVENNVLAPRIIGHSLGLHPVLVIVGALVGASLGGIPGLLLAAPTLATLKGIGHYLYCKMFDLPPWPAGAWEQELDAATSRPPPPKGALPTADRTE